MLSDCGNVLGDAQSTSTSVRPIADKVKTFHRKKKAVPVSEDLDDCSASPASTVSTERSTPGLIKPWENYGWLQRGLNRRRSSVVRPFAELAQKLAACRNRKKQDTFNPVYQQRVAEHVALFAEVDAFQMLEEVEEILPWPAVEEQGEDQHVELSTISGAAQAAKSANKPTPAQHTPTATTASQPYDPDSLRTSTPSPTRRACPAGTAHMPVTGATTTQTLQPDPATASPNCFSTQGEPDITLAGPSLLASPIQSLISASATTLQVTADTTATSAAVEACTQVQPAMASAPCQIPSGQSDIATAACPTTVPPKTNTDTSLSSPRVVQLEGATPAIALLLQTKDNMRTAASIQRPTPLFAVTPSSNTHVSSAQESLLPETPRVGAKLFHIIKESDEGGQASGEAGCSSTSLESQTCSANSHNIVVFATEFTSGATAAAFSCKTFSDTAGSGCAPSGAAVLATTGSPQCYTTTDKDSKEIARAIDKELHSPTALQCSTHSLLATSTCFRSPAAQQAPTCANADDESSTTLLFPDDVREQLTGLQKLLKICGQSICLEDIASMSSFLKPLAEIKKMVKIGEGAYGEAFKYQNKVFKLVPIEGEQLVNGYPQKKAMEMSGEALVALSLNALRGGQTGDGSASLNRTVGFVQTHGVGVCHGPYPKELITAWNKWDRVHVSENDPVEGFSPDQLYLVICMSDGGQDLEKYPLQGFDQARSILLQVCMTLAVAEEACEFEHRDMHWGNILLKPAEGLQAPFRLRGVDVQVETHGVETTLIDFTNSRLKAVDGDVAYCDMSLDPEIFEGPKGEIQFDTYRFMRNLTCDDWSGSYLQSNCIWISYLAEVLINKLGKVSATKKRQLREFRKRAVQCTNCRELVWDPLFDGLWLASSNAG